MADAAAAAAEAAFVAKKAAREKAKRLAKEGGVEEDPRNAWKKDYHQTEGPLLHVMRMGVPSLKEYLIGLGCTPEKLEGLNDKDFILNRIAPEYLTKAGSGEVQGWDMIKQCHMQLASVGIYGVDNDLLRSFINMRNLNMYEAVEDYITFTAWSKKEKTAIADEVYKQGRGEGVEDNNSAYYAQRRQDLRTKASHEQYIKRFPPPEIPKERPKAAAPKTDQVEVPAHLV